MNILIFNCMLENHDVVIREAQCAVRIGRSVMIGHHLYDFGRAGNVVFNYQFSHKKF